MSDVRLLGAGGAVGALRLAAADVNSAWGRGGGRGQSAVCAPDEDVLTLAWDAATAAMAAAGIAGDDVTGLWWGTSRPPFAEGPSHAYLAASLGLPADAGGGLLSGSSHAGMEALAAACDAILAGSTTVALVVASDAIVPATGSPLEARAGAGAAAWILGAAGGTARVVRRVTRSVPAVDRYRGDGEEATREVYDGRLFREEVFVPAMVEIGRGIDAGEGARWSLPDPDGRLGAAVARRLDAGTPASAGAFSTAGDTGAAAPLLGALDALGEEGTVAVVGYGGGRATAVQVSVDTAVPVRGDITGGRPASYPEVLRARNQLVAAGETVPMGVPPGSAQFVRGNPEILGLLGARCVDCGVVSTPPSIHPTCVGCGGEKLEAVSLARSGSVHTYVVNHTMPAPFVAPLPLAVVDLDDGARLMVQVIGPGDDLTIGTEVDLVLRRYAFERGVPVYGYKAKPRRGGASQ